MIIFAFSINLKVEELIMKRNCGYLTSLDIYL